MPRPSQTRPVNVSSFREREPVRFPQYIALFNYTIVKNGKPIKISLIYTEANMVCLQCVNCRTSKTLSYLDQVNFTNEDRRFYAKPYICGNCRLIEDIGTETANTYAIDINAINPHVASEAIAGSWTEEFYSPARYSRPAIQNLRQSSLPTGMNVTFDPIEVVDTGEVEVVRDRSYCQALGRQLRMTGRRISTSVAGHQHDVDRDARDYQLGSPNLSIENDPINPIEE